MTREKAIKIVKEFINGMCLHLADREALETLIPELRESEDERMRKTIVELVKWVKTQQITDHFDNGVKWDEMLVYLEKQKEQSKEELVYRLNGLMQEYIKEGKDEAEKEYRFKCYQLFWNALEDADFFERKEQKSAKYIKRNSKEWYSLLAEQYDKGFWKGKAEQKPAEWSDENEEMLGNVLGTYKTLEDMLDLSTEQDRDILKSMNLERAWLESFPERFNPRPMLEQLKKLM